MKTAIIVRNEIGYKQSLGTLVLRDEKEVLFSCDTLERGWINNEKQVSCVPEGVYLLRLEYSPKFGRELWELYGVPNRTECKFHSANYWHELNGCISLGESRFDINGDGLKDVVSSRNALEQFHNAFGSDRQAKLVVINSNFPL